MVQGWVPLTQPRHHSVATTKDTSKQTQTASTSNTGEQVLVVGLPGRANRPGSNKIDFSINPCKIVPNQRGKAASL